MPENLERENELSIIRLKYKKGDLVIKEGDFGLSIYKIIEGKVNVYRETDEVIHLASLGPGAIMGELVFLDEMKERRTASVRAAEDTILEVWHPRLLKREYEEMPPIIRYLADQTLKRLIRMNKLVVKLADKKKKKSRAQEAVEPPESKRRYFRKKVSLPFRFYPLYSDSKGKLTGSIKDISLGGAGLEVMPMNSPVFPYRVGEEFILKTTLPNNKDVEITCRLVSIREGKLTASLFLGISFIEMSDHSSKNLGFFMMP